MAVEKNTVYLIPPKKNITYHSGRLFLRDYVQGTLNHPIDIFSIPWRRRKRNTPSPWSSPAPGSDGTGGIKTTREKGGLTIVQEPSTAKFDGMPRSAIATGVVDYVLSPRDIADELLHYAQHHAIVEPEDETLFTDEESFSHLRGAEKGARHRLYPLQAHHRAAPHRAPHGRHPQHEPGRVRPRAGQQPEL